jgi:hypothetical protein
MSRKGSATLREPVFVGNQGQTVIDPDFDIGSGLEHEIQPPNGSTNSRLIPRTPFKGFMRRSFIAKPQCPLL